MTPAAYRWVVLAASVLAYLSAAKTHGRQMRLERELAGHWEVSFRAVNHPFVEALWFRERAIYWTLAAVLALAAIAHAVLRARRKDPLHPIFVVLTCAIWPLAIAFIAAGIGSQIRLALAISADANAAAVGAMPAGWLDGALFGSVAWWASTVLLAGLVIALARGAKSLGRSPPAQV
jgi:hypothetical protein